MNTELKIYRLLRDFGEQNIAQILECSQQEVNRKLNGENGFKLTQLAQVFDAAGIQLAGPDDVVITKAKYEALRVFAREALGE